MLGVGVFAHSLRATPASSAGKNDPLLGGPLGKDLQARSTKTSRGQLPSHARHPQAEGDQLLCWFEDDTEGASLSVNVQTFVCLPFPLTIPAVDVVFVSEIEA